MGYFSRKSASQAREEMADLINKVAFGGERIILDRHGKAIAALVSIDDFNLLQAIEDKVDIESAKKALKEPGSFSWEEIKSSLSL